MTHTYSTESRNQDFLSKSQYEDGLQVTFRDRYSRTPSDVGREKVMV
jgi:hypothetical protein